jgi:hypothetical protein
MVHHGLGDVVLALPALLSLKDRALSMLLVTRTEFEASFLGAFFSDRSATLVRPISAGGSRLRGASGVILAARRLRVDSAIVLHGGRHALQSLLFSMAGVPWTSVLPGGGVQRPRTPEHKSIRALRLVGGDASRPVTELLADGLLIRRARALAEGMWPNRIVLAPGSRGIEHKRWPPEAYASLARRLVQMYPGTKVCLLGSRAERGLLEAIWRSAAVGNQCEIECDLSVFQSLGLLSQARAVVAACSGTLHLAAVVGANAVGLYGPTSEAETGPFGNATSILRAACACAPCFSVDFRDGCVDPRCMHSISVESVCAEVSRRISGASAERPAPRLVSLLRRHSCSDDHASALRSEA